MELVAKTFKATFSAVTNRWIIDLGEIKFEIPYLHIPRVKGMRTKWQIVTAENVELEWMGAHITIKKCSKLKKKHLYTAFDPDKPKNLAKTVTVK